jgi:hypothetical protein
MDLKLPVVYLDLVVDKTKLSFRSDPTSVADPGPGSDAVLLPGPGIWDPDPG